MGRQWKTRLDECAHAQCAIVSPGVVYEGLKDKGAATVGLGKFGFSDQANQEDHDDYHQDHYGTGRAR